MMSITFCLVVGNDWYFILCNFGGLIMRSFKEREGASGSLLSPFHPPPPSALPPLQEETKSPVLKCYYDQNLMSSLLQKRFVFSLSEVAVRVSVIEVNFGAL